VDVFWDLDFSGLSLQTTPGLSPINWQPVSQVPLQTNGYFVVSFTNLADKAFFRLKKN